MKKLMLALLAVLVCLAFVAPNVRADDAKDDGPDMKETLKWIKKYLNEETYGTHKVFVEKPWALPAEVSIEYTGDGEHVFFKLKDLDRDKIRVEEVKYNAIRVKERKVVFEPDTYNTC